MNKKILISCAFILIVGIYWVVFDGADQVVTLTILHLEKNGHTFGIIGATTPNLPFISRPANIAVDSNLVTVVQNEITRIDPDSGPVRVAGGANPDAVMPDPEVRAQVTGPVQAFVAALETNDEMNFKKRKT